MTCAKQVCSMSQRKEDEMAVGLTHIKQQAIDMGWRVENVMEKRLAEVDPISNFRNKLRG